MSSVSQKRPPSVDRSFDFGCSLDDFEFSPHRDSRFLSRRLDEALLREGATAGGRTLDVACGSGRLVARLWERGTEGWGLEPSREMLGISRWLFPAQQMNLVRSVAEVLPFRDGTFDRLICQGSLDHFAYPHAFMEEAARVLKSNGRLVIALANYESLSCRLGRLVHRLGRKRLTQPGERTRSYWEPPPDHHHKGEPAFVRRLGGKQLRLERWFGVSLLWLLEGWGEWRWGRWLDEIPHALAHAFLVTLDRIAYRLPVIADVIVSVWRPGTTADVQL